MEEMPISAGGKRVLNTVKDDLFPILKELRDLLLRVHRSRPPFPLYSPNLSSLTLEFEELSASFFGVVRKLETPDILFSGLTEDPRNIADYFQFQGAFLKQIEEGGKYIEIIDRTLDRKTQAIQNSRTLVLALIAIIASLITFLK